MNIMCVGRGGGGGGAEVLRSEIKPAACHFTGNRRYRHPIMIQ